MSPRPHATLTLSRDLPAHVVLSGPWTATGMDPVPAPPPLPAAERAVAYVLDTAAITGMDSAGALTIQQIRASLLGTGVTTRLAGLDPRHGALLEAAAERIEAEQSAAAPAHARAPNALARVGASVLAAAAGATALLAFLGEVGLAVAAVVAHPARLRCRSLLHNLRLAGIDALPIVGLLSFLMGVVIAYQGADQLRQYGANIFVADLVGLSMVREFSPLMTAIIIAGRSGSANAAQIGTMAVTEELDAMRTIGLDPVDVLVLPKLLALLIAMPLLTAFADVLGVAGGMVMARAQLGIGFPEFTDRLLKAVSPTAYLVGIGKAPVFAAIIGVIGCFQGFRTHGDAGSVGRQTTRSVVQSIFLVVVADGLFSVVFSALDL